MCIVVVAFVAQSQAEALVSEARQCGFESRQRHHTEKDQTVR